MPEVHVVDAAADAAGAVDEAALGRLLQFQRGRDAVDRQPQGLLLERRPGRVLDAHEQGHVALGRRRGVVLQAVPHEDVGPRGTLHAGLEGAQHVAARRARLQRHAPGQQDLVLEVGGLAPAVAVGREQQRVGRQVVEVDARADGDRHARLADVLGRVGRDHAQAVEDRVGARHRRRRPQPQRAGVERQRADRPGAQRDQGPVARVGALAESQLVLGEVPVERLAAHGEAGRHVLAVERLGDARQRRRHVDFETRPDAARVRAAVEARGHQEVVAVGLRRAARVAPVPGDRVVALEVRLVVDQALDQRPVGRAAAHVDRQPQRLGQPDRDHGVLRAPVAVGREHAPRDAVHRQVGRLLREREVAHLGRAVAGPVAERLVERVRPRGQARDVPEAVEGLVDRQADAGARVARGRLAGLVALQRQGAPGFLVEPVAAGPQLHVLEAVVDLELHAQALDAGLRVARDALGRALGRVEDQRLGGSAVHARLDGRARQRVRLAVALQPRAHREAALRLAAHVQPQRGRDRRAQLGQQHRRLDRPALDEDARVVGVALGLDLEEQVVRRLGAAAEDLLQAHAVGAEGHEDRQAQAARVALVHAPADALDARREAQDVVGFAAVHARGQHVGQVGAARPGQRQLLAQALVAPFAAHDQLDALDLLAHRRRDARAVVGERRRDGLLLDRQVAGGVADAEAEGVAADLAARQALHELAAVDHAESDADLLEHRLELEAGRHLAPGPARLALEAEEDRRGRIEGRGQQEEGRRGRADGVQLALDARRRQALRPVRFDGVQQEQLLGPRRLGHLADVAGQVLGHEGRALDVAGDLHVLDQVGRVA